MMKFFRKYNRQILAAIVVFLMIVFLGGEALQGMISSNPNALVGTSRYGNIRAADQDYANQSTRVLQAMGYPWNNPSRGVEPYSELEWILLTREAEQLGTLAQPEAVHAWLGPAMSEETIDTVARNFRVRPAVIEEGLRQMKSIQLTAVAINNASFPSSAEVRQAAANELDKATIKAVVVPGISFVDSNQQFTDAELTAQFDKYKATKKGDGLNFGYLIPQTVKVQYIKIDRNMVGSKLGVPNLEAKAKAYYEDHKQDVFRRPPGTEPPPPPAGQEDCAEDDPRTIDRKSFLQWEEQEAQTIAMNIVRNRAADETLARMGDWIIPQLTDEWSNLSSGDDGYRIVKENDPITAPNRYEELLKRVPKNLAFPEAISIATTDFFRADKAKEVPQVGEAVYRTDRGQLESIRTIPFRNKKFVPTIPTQPGVDPTNYLSLHQTSRYPLTDTQGNLYIVRVVDARDEHAPDSLAEVRTQVTEDLRLAKGFETAKAHAKTLLDTVKQGKTLREAYDQMEALAPAKTTPGGFFEPTPFSKVASGLGAVGRKGTTTFVPGNVGRIPNEAVDAIFAQENSSDKIASHEMPERAAILVTEFVSVTHGREDEFEKIHDRLSQGIADQRQQAAVRDWFDAEKIRLRTGFEFAGAKDKKNTGTK